MMTYRYFIGYATESKHGAQCLECSAITREKPISNMEDVKDIQDKLAKDLEKRRVILLSFSKLEGVE